MENSRNYFKELDSLNQMLTSNVVANKYDYETLQVSKTQRTTFRRNIRKLVCNVYENVDSYDKAELIKFADYMLIALLSAKNKTFDKLKANDVYPSFNKLSDKDLKLIESAHKKIIEKIKSK